MRKFQYKYKLMSKAPCESRFTEYMQFTFNPIDTQSEIQSIWPLHKFKVIINPKRNI